MSPQDFAELNSRYGGASATAKTKKTRKGGSKFEGWRGSAPTAWLSEAGGLGGAAAGAVAGQIAIPSPVLGALIGGFAGGALGGGLGSAAEQKIRDDKVSGGKVARDAAVEGIFGAGPLRGVRAAGTLAKGAAKSGVKEAYKQSAEKGGIGVVTGKGMQKAGDDLRRKSFRITPTQEFNFESKSGRQLEDVLKEHNIWKATDFQKAAKPIQANYDQGLKAIGDIPTADVTRRLTVLAQKHSAMVGTANTDKGKALLKEARNVADYMRKNYGKTIPATELNKKIKLAYDAIAKHNDKPEQEAMRNIANLVAREVRGSINDAGKDVGIRDVAGRGMKDMGLELQNLYHLAPIAKKQANLGHGAQPFNLHGGAATTTGAVLGGPGGAALGLAGERLINSRPGMRAISKGLTGTGKAVEKTGRAMDIPAVGAGVRAGLGGGLAGLMAGGSASALSDGSEGDESLYDTSSDGSIGATGSTSLSDAAQANPEMLGGSPYTRENLIKDIQANPKFAKDYISMYKELAEIYAPSTGNKMNSTAAGVVADTKTGLRTLAQLGQTINDSNANNPFIGPVRGVIPWDTEAKNIQADIATAKQIVGKALEGGVLRKEDEIKYRKILPKLGDTDAVAQHKIDTLITLISNRLTEFEQNYTGGGSDLSDVYADYYNPNQ